MLVLALPDPSPVSEIIHRAIKASVDDPERQHDRSAPDDDARREAHPEHDCQPQHVEEFEREEEDDQHQGDGREVGLLDHALDGWDEVGLDCGDDGLERAEVGWRDIAGLEQVGCPVCYLFSLCTSWYIL